MKTLAITVKWNASGKADATGAFQPEAKNFSKIHGGRVVIVDNHMSAVQIRKAVAEAIQADQPELLAFFCHGWSSGLQLWPKGTVDELAALLSTSHPLVVLYACSTGYSSFSGGDGGFADKLRDASGCQVDAHTTAGHCCKNPYVRRFAAGAPSVGGEFIVAPGSPKWHAWIAALKTDFRFQFPTLDLEAIREQI